MVIEELSWTAAQGWCRGAVALPEAQLVLYFGPEDILATADWFAPLRATFPAAHLLGCSTGGQFRQDDLLDATLVAVALRFDRTRLRLAQAAVPQAGASQAAGLALGRQLRGPELAGVFLLSDGLQVNGSALVDGLLDGLEVPVPVTGGLAGDGDRFGRTLVGADALPGPGLAAAIGFYGPALRFSTGSAGGWAPFGPRRRITAAEGPVLHCLDGEPALDLYRRYLGDEAGSLPGSALLFPLQVWPAEAPERGMVRTVLAVDAAARSLTFAGDVPLGWRAQLMRSTVDRLVQAAADAAAQTLGDTGPEPGPPPGTPRQDRLAILVSCIGRRLLLGQRTAEELEAAGAVLGPDTRRIGFYAYGEIAPRGPVPSQLHNQTVTITCLEELP